ncbi:uncharacterized protein AB675_6250 [Cyphellophora attinorum]|uniref:Uncharacterized protein n=1 Tax=Cyphellophora attinorum TaxID=1664694 RepID=A0A0N1HEI1_9EURO|nr:uncharacterized protein AB675_6250 [Phialophora attinorum]KPI43834.1 hypothetical protein AB675_6250 [Phialophora attinorum]
MDMPPTAPYFPPPPTTTSSKRNPQRPTRVDTSLPSPLRRSRKFLLPPLLLLSFACVVLSTIYAYCIASPHTHLTAADYAHNPQAELNESLFRRDGGSPITSLTPALALYALTTPLATIVLILAETALQILRPKLNYSRPFLTLCTAAALAIAFGWIATSILWVHCEISPLQHAPGSQNVCPASVRGHFMWGIHELSWARAALGFLVGVGFMLHAFCAVKSLKSAVRQLKGHGGVGNGLGLQHGEAQMVDIEREMEEGLRVQRSLRLGMKRVGRECGLLAKETLSDGKRP